MRKLALGLLLLFAVVSSEMFSATPAATPAPPASATYTYDALGRLVQIKYPSYTISYTYDTNGNRTATTTAN